MSKRYKFNAMETILFLFLVLPLAFILNGFTFSTIWGWFVVPAFGLPNLGIAISSGILLLITFACSHAQHDDETFDESLTRIFAKPLVCLLCGVILKQFI